MIMELVAKHVLMDFMPKVLNVYLVEENVPSVVI